jgi:hypothetical protein
VPSYGDVKLRPCPQSPRKKDIFEVIVKMATESGINLGINSADLVNTEWLLTILSTINPNHFYFSKDYHPGDLKKEKDKLEFLQNDDKLFD